MSPMDLENDSTWAFPLFVCFPRLSTSVIYETLRSLFRYIMLPKFMRTERRDRYMEMQRGKLPCDVWQLERGVEDYDPWFIILWPQYNYEVCSLPENFNIIPNFLFLAFIILIYGNLSHKIVSNLMAKWEAVCGLLSVNSSWCRVPFWGLWPDISLTFRNSLL
jgi:hypothetical protein